MDKEEILMKSRNENKGRDMAKIEENRSSARFAIIFGFFFMAVLGVLSLASHLHCFCNEHLQCRQKEGTQIHHTVAHDRRSISDVYVYHDLRDLSDLSLRYEKWTIHWY